MIEISSFPHLLLRRSKATYRAHVRKLSTRRKGKDRKGHCSTPLHYPATPAPPPHLLPFIHCASDGQAEWLDQHWCHFLVHRVDCVGCSRNLTSRIIMIK